MAYKPAQRSVPCRILTRAGWITGSFHVPEKGRFVEFLNRPTEFVRLTSVTMKGRFDELPFMALQRSSMVLVLPPEDERNLQWHPDVEKYVTHDVACLLDLGLVTGKMKILRGARVSDVFAHKSDFALLEPARIRVGPPGAQQLGEQDAPLCIINADCVIGVSDVSAPEAEIEADV